MPILDFFDLVKIVYVFYNDIRNKRYVSICVSLLSFMDLYLYLKVEYELLHTIHYTSLSAILASPQPCIFNEGATHRETATEKLLNWLL